MPSSSTAPEGPGSVSGVPNLPSDLREGYAEIGDMRLHYVEAGEGPLVVLLHGFPEFWYGWRLQIQPLAAAGFRVVAPDMRGYNLSSRPDGVKAYDTGQLTADIRGLIHERGAQSALLVGHDWGGSVAWATAMNYPEVVDRLAILNAAHPRKLSQGLHHPGQLRKSWYFFFFDLPDLPETVVHADHWHFFRHFLRDARPAYTPEEIDRYIEAWSQPGAATGMINYYRSSVRTSPKTGRSGASPDQGAHPGHLGAARSLPRPRTSRARPRRRAQPGPRRAPARRLALGPSRRGMSASTSCSPTSSPPPEPTKNAECRRGNHPAGPGGAGCPVRLQATTLQAIGASSIVPGTTGVWSTERRSIAMTEGAEQTSSDKTAIRPLGRFSISSTSAPGTRARCR